MRCVELQSNLKERLCLSGFLCVAILISLAGMKNSIWSGMTRKIAGSGLTFNHLLLAFERGGSEGLLAVLKERTAGKPSVTADKRFSKQLFPILKTCRVSDNFLFRFCFLHQDKLF